MRYIICDDNEQFALSLKSRILALQPDARVEIFVGASALLFYFEEVSEKVDALFMDVKLNSDNGIDIAGKLLPRFPGIKLVYVTGYGSEYIQDFFACPSEAQPVALLTKPIEQRFLRNALEKIACSTEAAPVAFEQGGGVLYLKPDSIVSIASDRRKLIITADSGSYELYGKISEVSARLPDHFVQCHKSYIANLHRASEIKGWTSILMDDGSVCPISRSYKEQVKTATVLINK